MGCPGTGSGGSDFNPRSPQGERRRGTIPTKANQIFQSTLPARGATTASTIVRVPAEFQSTLPARGATIDRQVRRRKPLFISIHAPREGSDAVPGKEIGYDQISIHAPREGSDLRGYFGSCTPRNFNPRSPRGERPPAPSQPGRGRSISIHAPREGSDGEVQNGTHELLDFNPRSPRGERLKSGLWSTAWNLKFQSTLPARGATAFWFDEEKEAYISIHAPREGSDYPVQFTMGH